ncbi:MAG: hypothetical protein CML42_07600 [Rhodobacteraceae bacterium]|nr:hypothetical protein [Paracoccaceae bacterium]|tara:strand:- start:17810 stop:18646 length:837 start_codon:yes stop_codon:yes gene_type:complete
MSYDLKPNDVKKQLMSRIKEYQKKKKILNDENENATNNNENFQKNFSDHMTYLNSVIKENKIKKKRKKEKKINKQIEAEKQQSQPIPVQEGIDIKPMETVNNNIISNNKTSIIIHGSKNPPPYSCLKNSSKPTYRQWQKSLKEKLTPQSHIVSPINDTQNKPNPILIRQKKLKDVKEKNKKKKKVKIRKTTFKLGKHNGCVSVLVKNRRTRKKLKKECNLLKKKTLPDVKEYLRQHNLIKIGTPAPEKVLRQIYENAYLSGDVFNKNPDNLIHNYMQN